jgi:predicted DNA-binding transcriptional regulator YafY
MRRADRLFRIVERLRRRRPSAGESAAGVTAAALAAELEVSPRTIYRDVQDLLASGVPIQGEAGVGYAMQRGFDLPPLMFTEEEIEALVLGARVVVGRADPALAAAARALLAKVEAVLPARLADRVSNTALFAPDLHPRGADERLGTLRNAVRARRKIAFAYRDRDDKPTTRTVQPLGVFFWTDVWSLGAWCELREGFRNFRVDRMQDLTVRADVFEPQPGRTLRDFILHCQEDRSVRSPRPPG